MTETWEHWRWIMPGFEIFLGYFQQSYEYQARLIPGHETPIYHKPNGYVIEIIRKRRIK